MVNVLSAFVLQYVNVDISSRLCTGFPHTFKHDETNIFIQSFLTATCEYLVIDL